MGYSYGSSTFQPTYLSRGRIGEQYVPHPKKRTNNTSMWRYIFGGLEVAAGAALTFFGGEGVNAALIGAGIGILGATGNTALSLAEGSDNAISETINWGAALIPLGGEYLMALRNARGISRSSFDIAEKITQDTVSNVITKDKALYKELFNKADSQLSRAETRNLKFKYQARTNNKRVNKIVEKWDSGKDLSKTQKRFASKHTGRSHKEVNRYSRQRKDLIERANGNTRRFNKDSDFMGRNKDWYTSPTTQRIKSMHGDNGEVTNMVYNDLVRRGKGWARDAKYGSESINSEIKMIQQAKANIRSSQGARLTHLENQKVQLVKQMRKLDDNIKNWSFSKSWNKRVIRKNLDKEFKTLGVDREFREVFETVAKASTYGSDVSQKVLTTYVVKNLISSLPKGDREMFQALLNSSNKFMANHIAGIEEKEGEKILTLMKGENNFEEEAAGVIDNISEEAETLIARTIERYNYDSIGGMFHNYFIDIERNLVQKSKLRKFIKYSSSKRFNDRVVQPVQSIFDANDHGRMYIELAYRKLRKKINAMFEKKISKRIKREARSRISKAVKASEKAVKEFEKTGGRTWPSTRYIMGHKVIRKIPASNKYIVMISFNKFNTMGKGKNLGGKKPIFITATRHDLKMFRETGTRYWWDHATARGWSVSRGGHRTKFKALQVIETASYSLTFIRINLLRNWFSITSNVVENTASMARGTYLNTYVHNFTGSVSRALINRPSRLLTRVLLGGYAKKVFGKRLGDFIGRESQRYSRAVLSSIQGKTKSGFGFKFNFNNVGARIQRNIKVGAAASVKAEVGRFGKGIGKSGSELTELNKKMRSTVNQGRLRISAKRNYNNLFRAYSALTPRKSVPSIRKLTRFK